MENKDKEKGKEIEGEEVLENGSEEEPSSPLAETEYGRLVKEA